MSDEDITFKIVGGISGSVPNLVTMNLGSKNQRYFVEKQKIKIISRFIISKIMHFDELMFKSITQIFKIVKCSIL